MTGMGGESAGVRWHQALAYAVTGRRAPELGLQVAPDLSFLTDWLEPQTPHERAARPYVVPADLMAGIGPAQFWAVLTRLRAGLRPGAGSSTAPVLADRQLTLDERRLMADVPPHHGS